MSVFISGESLINETYMSKGSKQLLSKVKLKLSYNLIITIKNETLVKHNYLIYKYLTVYTIQ